MSRLETEVEFVDALLRWYEDNGRHELPWRKASPFEVLVAEFMLQRTSAEQVLGVFEPFVAKYPDARSVAGAEEDELREAIAPLGLRKRARYLERTSETLVERYDGDVPSDRDELLELEGVGEYTANSVLAHTYEEDVAAVDTNVARILSRVYGTEEDPESTEAWEKAERLVPAGRGSDFLHALIDFGAGVCTASSPNCTDCPLADICEYEAKDEDRRTD